MRTVLAPRMCCCPGNWEARRAKQGGEERPCGSRFALPSSLVRLLAKAPRLPRIGLHLGTPPWLHNHVHSRASREQFLRAGIGRGAVGFNVQSSKTIDTTAGRRTV